VNILYRRGRAEMPAWEREVSEAERVGVVLHFLASPVAFGGAKGRLTEVRICRVELGQEEETGRRSAVPIPGSTYVMPCDAAILATGMRLDRRPLGKLPVTRQGLIKTDGSTRRVRGNVFAGGDVANAAQTIVAAVRDGKLAAAAIVEFLGVWRGSR
jgi:NADPH-dependent glutamate synthase beta subunit-like oxidoreductase